MSLFDAKTPINQVSNRHYSKDNNENGSIIFWILIMIALLAALYYTFSNGFRAGENQLSKEKVDLYATEILDYAQSIKQAVQTLQINGCDETEISFENNISSDSYVNPNAPSDKSCHVFNPNGGGLTYITPNKNYLNNNYSAITLSGGMYGDYRFNGKKTIDQIGSTEPELIFIANFINKDVCMKINDKMGVSNNSEDAPDDTVSTSGGPFSGTYGTPLADPLGDDVNGYLTGKTTACWKNSSNNVYQFYQVLIVR